MNRLKPTRDLSAVIQKIIIGAVGQASDAHPEKGPKELTGSIAKRASTKIAQLIEGVEDDDGDQLPLHDQG